MRPDSPGRPLHELRLVSKYWNEIALRIASIWLVFNGRNSTKLCKHLRSRYPYLAAWTKRIDLPLISSPPYSYRWDVDALTKICKRSPNLQTISFVTTNSFQDGQFYDKFCKILRSLPKKASVHMNFLPGSWNNTVPAVTFDTQLTRIRFLKISFEMRFQTLLLAPCFPLLEILDIELFSLNLSNTTRWFERWSTPSLKCLVLTCHCEPTPFLENFLGRNGKRLESICFQGVGTSCLPPEIENYCPKLSTILTCLFKIDSTVFIPREPLTLVITTLPMDNNNEDEKEFLLSFKELWDQICDEDFHRMRGSTIRFKYISWYQIYADYISMMEMLRKSGKTESWNFLDKDGVHLEEYLAMTNEGLIVPQNHSSDISTKVKGLEWHGKLIRRAS